jgi:O-antigen ligase
MAIRKNWFVSIWIMLAMLFPSSITLFGISFFDIVVYGSLGLIFLHRLTHRDSLKYLTKIDLILIIFLILQLVTYIYNGLSSFDQQKKFIEETLKLSSDSIFLRLSFYGVATIIMLIGCYQFVVTSVKTQKDVKFLINLIIICGLINSIVTSVYWLVSTGGVFDRYNFIPPIELSQGIHQNNMSILLVLSIAVLVGGNIRNYYKMFLLFTIIMATLSISTVMVRQGWVTTLLVLVLFLFLMRLKRGNEKNSNTSLISISTALFLIILIFNWSFIFELFGDIFNPIIVSDNTEGSWFLRFALIQNGFAVFLDHIALGVGYGHYSAYSIVPIYVTGEAVFVSSPHNGIVTIAAETGIFGLICFLLINYYLVRGVYFVYNNSLNLYASSISAAVFSLLVFVIITQFISNTYILPLPTERLVVQGALLYWILFGTILSMKKNGNL